MSKKVEIVLNNDGIQQLLKSSEMQAILSGYGKQKAGQAGNGYDSEVHVHSKRAVANIFPADAEAAKDNYTNNTLLKVIS